MKKIASEKQQLNITVFFNMLGPILLNGIGFFTMPIFTRMLGTDNYGLYTIYYSYQNILIILMGLQTQVIIGTVSIYFDGKERDRYFSNALSISLFCSLFVALIIFCFIKPVEAYTGISSLMIVVMLIHTASMICVNWMSAKLAYDKCAKANFLLSVGLSVVSILLSLVLIYFADNGVGKYKAYIFGYAVPYLIAGTICAVILLSKGKSFFYGKAWKFCLAFCLPLIFHALSNTVLHQCDKIMIKNFMGDSATGIYGFAVTFANVMSIIFNALNTTWVPFYHDDVKNNQTERLKTKTNNYVFLFTCLTVGFIMAMPEVVKLFAQKDFWSSINLIPILALGIYFVFLYTFPVNFEFYYKKTKNIAFGTLLAAIANIFLNYIFIPKFGMIGAAAATLLSYVLLYVFHLFMAKTVIKEQYHYPYKFFYAYLAAVVVFVALFYVIKDIIWLRWLIFVLAAALLLFRIYRNRSIF